MLWQGAKKSALAGFDSQAVAINDRGQVAGNREGGRAFLWSKGRLTGLGALSRDASSYAAAMNERGQIVGSSETARGERRAFIWENGKLRSLGTLGGKESWVMGESRRGDLNFATFYPEAINELGQVVGTSTTRAGCTQCCGGRRAVQADSMIERTACRGGDLSGQLPRRFTLTERERYGQNAVRVRSERAAT